MWEYKTLTLPIFENPTEKLNMLGEDNWELVSVITVHDTCRYFFKRPIPESEAD